MDRNTYMKEWYRKNPLGKNPHKKVCLGCHKLTDTWGRKVFNLKKGVTI